MASNPNQKQKHQRAIKVRLYPTDPQKILLEKTFGCCRFIWNQMLGDERRFYAETDKHFIVTPAKYKKMFPFLREVDSLALANVQLDLKEAFSRFFNDSKRTGFPRFKAKKRTKSSYTTNCQYSGNRQTIQLTHKGIRFPKIGIVRANIYRQPMPGWKLKSATVSKTKSGKYFCSLLFEFFSDAPKDIPPSVETGIGLDYSSPSFYVDNNNQSPDIPHWFRESEKKLAKYQRQLSHMTKASENYKEQLHKIQLLHEHIANQRKDFAHKESRRIANVYGTVCVEDLNMRNMGRSLNLGKSTGDNGFGMFRNFLQYKLEEQGKHLILLDKWYPSSKTCRFCGFVNAELTLKDRPSWNCPSCGRTILRDQNAAINILQAGILQYYSPSA